MKRLLALVFLAFTMTAGITNQAKAVDKICFTDAYGYQYSITNITMTEMGKYTGTGTISNITSYDWVATMTADFSSGTGYGTVEIHAINAQLDGCQSGYVDSFIYVGNATYLGKGYSGSGTWTNYCNGYLQSTGEWSAQGPCGSYKSVPKKTKDSPAMVSGKNAGKKISTDVVNKICFTDTYGYQYSITNITMTGMGMYYGTGTVTNIGTYDWEATMTADFTAGAGNGVVEIHAINPLGDNCFSGYTDSFIYVGTATHVGAGYSGSGTWSSYCGSDVTAVGEWAAQGPCPGLRTTPPVNKTGITPASAKKPVTEDKVSLKIAPNPATNFTQVSYKVTTPGKVNVTVYNAMQQPVKVLVNETKQAGSYSATWNATTSSGAPVLNGVYRVVAVVGNSQYTGTVQVSR